MTQETYPLPQAVRENILELEAENQSLRTQLASYETESASDYHRRLLDRETRELRSHLAEAEAQRDEARATKDMHKERQEELVLQLKMAQKKHEAATAHCASQAAQIAALAEAALSVKAFVDELGDTHAYPIHAILNDALTSDVRRLVEERRALEEIAALAATLLRLDIEYHQVEGEQVIEVLRRKNETKAALNLHLRSLAAARGAR